ncbi:probable G-protein coupled receptor 139 [Heptranchias perlo]|uniref:probable G-protein coupled receptor 139 n=1 Tax=Heptranchias perlo TaxID=212740 RepID=UPI00355A5663
MNSRSRVFGKPNISEVKHISKHFFFIWRLEVISKLSKRKREQLHRLPPLTAVCNLEIVHSNMRISVDFWAILSPRAESSAATVHEHVSVAFPANFMTIVILSRGNCGLSKCISGYMVAMATGDLLVMIINIIVYHIFSYQFPLSFLSFTPVCRFILYMTVVTLDLSVWFTVSFTFERFVALCCQKFKTKYCTERTAAAVLTTFFVLIFLKDIPVLFPYAPERIINKVQWGCRESEAVLSSPPITAYGSFHGISLVWLPFTLIALFNSLTIRRISVASRARKALRGHSSEDQCDPEMENRRKSIILLFTISGTFIILWLTTAVSLLTTRLTNSNYYRGDRTNPGYIATETGAMLKFLSCCPNTCIYAATQRKFREELKKLLKSPWTLILRLVKTERNAK